MKELIAALQVTNFRTLIGHINSIITKVFKHPDQRQRESAMVSLDQGFLLFCKEHNVAPTIQELQTGLSDMSTPHTCCVKLAVAFLQGELKVSQTRFGQRNMEDILSVVDAVHKRNEEVLAKILPAVLTKIHSTTGGDALKDMTAICKSPVLRMCAGQPVRDGDRPPACDVQFVPQKQLSKFLQEATSMLEMIAQAKPVISPGSAVVILWRSYCSFASNLLPTLNSQGASLNENLAKLQQFPQSLQYQQIVLDSLFCAELLEVIRTCRLIWAVPGAGQLVRICHRAFKGNYAQTFWSMQSLERFTRLCTEMEELNMQLASKDYNENTFNTYQAHLQSINGIFSAMDLPAIGQLQSIGPILEELQQLHPLLDWLRSQDVQAARLACNDLDDALSNRELTCRQAMEMIQSLRSEFEHPLRDQVCNGMPSVSRRVRAPLQRQEQAV